MKIMQERSSDQSNADGKRRRNDRKRLTILAFKIGAIFSSACGSRRRSPKTSFYNGGKEIECSEGQKRSVCKKNGLASNKTRPCQQIQVVKVDARKLHRKPHLTLSLSGILRNSSTGFNLRKWKMIKASSANARGTKLSILRPGFQRIIGKLDRQRGEETKKANDTEEARRGVELCKKRILMGEKCRALNPSGVLHYDEEGILLPEDVPI